MAAVVLIMIAALIAAKIGPIAAVIIRTTLEVIRLTALVVSTAIVVTALTWAVVKVIRWQLQRRATIAVSQARVFVMPGRQQTGPGGQPGCLACGGTGTALRAISGGYQPGQCLVCEPAQRAG